MLQVVKEIAVSGEKSFNVCDLFASLLNKKNAQGSALVCYFLKIQTVGG